MGFLAELSQVLLLIVGLMMIVVILLQRGRGGGLAGAFGGMGGQSAFGTRAGDVFTRITCGMAIVWVLLSGVSGLLIDRDAHAVSGSYKSAKDAGAAATESVDAPEGVKLGEPGTPPGTPATGEAAAGDETTGGTTVPPNTPITPAVTPDESNAQTPPATEGATPAAPALETPAQTPPASPSGAAAPQSDSPSPQAEGTPAPPAGDAAPPPAKD